MSEFREKKIVILGAGLSGQSAARLLLSQQAIIKISDSSPKDSISPEFISWADNNHVHMEFGEHTRDFVVNNDIVILSPGVTLNALPVQWANEARIPIIGEIELASQLCLCPIIAITGSNGKTTVSTLMRDILLKRGRKAYLCGNVGIPFSSQVSKCQMEDIVVLEVSSFQLETISQFKPYIAVFLNFSQNHLDRHSSLDEYFNLKMRIFSNQTNEDFAVLNSQDERMNALSEELKAKIIPFNTYEQQNELKSENPNYLAVSSISEILGIDQDVVDETFQSFQGVEHRMEKVSTVDGVDYINDSKSTTAESGRWALTSLDKPVIMICGGRDKNIDFSVLRDIIGKKVKKIYAIGESKHKIKRTFSSLVDVDECENLEIAVKAARDIALSGECVLLCPLCASFDMFSNFEERGRAYKDIVKNFNNKAVVK